MQEAWRLSDEPRPVAADSVVEAIEGRVSAGTMTTWLESSRGRKVALVCNGARAMVMLMEHDGDPGQHAVDPSGVGSSDGYLLENGQADEYFDRDTVPLAVALRIIAYLVSTGVPPKDVPWQVDR